MTALKSLHQNNVHVVILNYRLWLRLNEAKLSCYSTRHLACKLIFFIITVFSLSPPIFNGHSFILSLSFKLTCYHK